MSTQITFALSSNLHLNCVPALFVLLDGSVAYGQVQPAIEDRGIKRTFRIPWRARDAIVKERDGTMNILVL